MRADLPIVTFARSDLSAPFDPRAQTLLEFAEDLGVAPPSSCRSGLCGTCTTRKLAGEIEYVQEPAVTVAPDEVLLCCALPAGPVSLDL